MAIEAEQCRGRRGRRKGRRGAAGSANVFHGRCDERRQRRPSLRRSALPFAAAGNGYDRQARFRRSWRKVAAVSRMRLFPKQSTITRRRFMRSNPLGHRACGHAARSDAVFIFARSNVLVAPACGSGFATIQSEAGRGSGGVGGHHRHGWRARCAAKWSRQGCVKLYEEMDLPLVPVLARMEQAGVKIDTAALSQMSTELEREIAVKAKEIYEAAGMEFNVGSPKQLGDVLFNRMNLPKPVKYGKGRTISTAVDVLEELAENHPIARMVLDYRQLTKLKSTYVDALPALINPATGRLHTTFGQTGTATGRLSSANPNLQNIPIRTELGRGIRAAFIAEPGHVLLTADYSQIELRLLAHFSRDPLLVEAYRRGDDIHTLTASQVFGVPPLMVTPDHRRQAKVVNFGIVYGLSAFGLSQQLGIEPGEAKQFIAAYFEKYSGVRAFIDKTLEEARRDMKVKTLFGRVRPIPDINSKNANQRGFAERTAVNTPLQGTAADLIKIAMIRIDAALRERGLKSRMTLQVHDELVFEVPENEVETMQSLVREHMEKVHELAVPLQVDMGVGPNWRDLE